MHKLIVSAVLATIVGVSLFQMSADSQSPQVEVVGRAMFNKWLMENGKAYGNNDEKEFRYQNFKANAEEIESQKNENYTLALNEFADLTEEEFLTQRTGNRNWSEATEDEEEEERENLDDLEVPSSIDWVASGKVNPVQDQGFCGSCWTFSAICAVESHEAIETNTLRKYSEQALVDCGWVYGNKGCNGGWPDKGVKWAAVYGIPLLEDYPYTARQGDCKIHGKKRYNVNRGVRNIERTNASLVAAISKKVTTVAISASAIRFYNSGVFSNWDCLTRLDHAVNAVGYGTDSQSGKMFYKIRNSWGKGWGENGYIRFERRNTGTGMCGVTLKAFYPF